MSAPSNASDSSPPNKNQEAGGVSYLFAFDFDHTIVSDNSDTYVTKLAKSPVPSDADKFLKETKNWTEYMNKVFAFLHNEGVSIQEISECVQGMEPTKGMITLLKYLVQLKLGSGSTKGSSIPPPKIKLLVISDANDLFISDFLSAQVLSTVPNLNSPPCPTFQSLPFDIITNRASIPTMFQQGNSNNNEGSNNCSEAFSISPFENQTTCQICPKNLCKGSAILNYIEKHGPFTRIFYTGDGFNDVCPSLKLNQRDFVFVRKNYRMYKKLQESSNNLGITAKITYWDEADLILATIKENLQL